jgi:hypothetical protein
MKKIIFLVVFTLFNSVALWYLISPTPQIPDLPNSIVSQEPGDTVQLTNVKAFYTDMPRSEVMEFYRQNYTSPLRVNINHPPERAKDIFRNTMQSYYLEELFIPFKQSLYINGFEWENDVFTKPEKRIKNRLEYQGREFKSKVTLRYYPVSVSHRLIILAAFNALFIGLYFLYKPFFSKK